MGFLIRPDIPNLPNYRVIAPLRLLFALLVPVSVWFTGCTQDFPDANTFSHPEGGALEYISATPFAPYIARGTVLLKIEDKQEVGGMVLTSAANGAYGLRIHGRFVGGTAFDLRFDSHQLLLVDYLEDRYFNLENTPEHRARLFSFDLEPGEFGILITGRIAPGMIPDGRMRDAGSGVLEITRGQHRYVFQPGKSGLLDWWEKHTAGHLTWRVEYATYQTVKSPPATDSTELPMPRKVRLRDANGNQLMLLGVSTWEFPPEAPAIVFELPPEARDFTPAQLQ